MAESTAFKRTLKPLARSLPAGGARRSWGVWGRILVAGGLLGGSMPPGIGGIAAGGVVALGAWVPLLVRWRRGGTPAEGLQEAFGMALLASLIAFGWGLRHPVLPSALAAAGVMLLWALSLALPWAAGAVFVQRGQPGWAYVVWGAGTLGLDALWSIGPWALPWGRLGHTLAAVPVLPSLVSDWGVVGLSALVVLGNAFLTEAYLNLRLRWHSAPAAASRIGASRRRCAVLGSLAGGLLLHAVFLDAERAGRRGDPLGPSGTSDAAAVLFLVQPGTAPEDWATLDDARRVFDLQALTNAALDTASVVPDLVVWPETAIPPVHHDSVRRHVQRWVERRGVPLLTGAIAPVDGAATDRDPYRHANRLYLLQPHRPPHAYDKHHLVPFVERVPGINRLPALAALAVDGGGVNGYRRGAGATTLSTGSLRFAPLICMESVVGGYVRQAARQAPAPHVLITASHTGWWNSARPARQHLAFSRLRSLETGRPLALVTVRGPTTLVDRTGRVGRRLPWGARGVLQVAVPAGPEAASSSAASSP